MKENLIGFLIDFIVMKFEILHAGVGFVLEIMIFDAFLGVRRLI